jgi:hypothetical protein
MSRRFALAVIELTFIMDDEYQILIALKLLGSRDKLESSTKLKNINLTFF